MYIKNKTKKTKNKKKILFKICDLVFLRLAQYIRCFRHAFFEKKICET